MKIARVIGTVTLARAHPAIDSPRLRCIEVLGDIKDLDQEPYGGDTVVAWDLCSSGLGDRVALAEGPEAAQPFKPDVVPIDASLVAVLDHFDLLPRRDSAAT